MLGYLVRKVAGILIPEVPGERGGRYAEVPGEREMAGMLRYLVREVKSLVEMQGVSGLTAQ